MANGFVLGGIAEGMNASREQRRADQALGLERRALGLREQQAEREAAQQQIAEVDEAISNTMGLVKEATQAGLEAGRDPETILRSVAPLVQDAQELAAAVGRDPNRITAQVRALVTQPGANERARAEGQAEGARTLSQAGALQQGGISEKRAQLSAGIEREPLPENVQFQSVDGTEVVEIDPTTEEGRRQFAQLQRDPNFIEVGRAQIQAQDRAAAGLRDPGAPDVRKIIQAETATRNALSEVDRIREQIKEGAITGSLSGGVVRGLSNAAGELRQMARAFGGTDEEGILDPNRYNLSMFGTEAASSAAFRSNIINLAYMNARAADPAGRVSDPDMRNQLNSLAAGAGNQESILATLDEVERRTRTGFKNLYTASQRQFDNLPDFPDDLGPQEREEQQEGGQERQQGGQQEDQQEPMPELTLEQQSVFDKSVDQLTSEDMQILEAMPEAAFQRYMERNGIRLQKGAANGGS